MTVDDPDVAPTEVVVARSVGGLVMIVVGAAIVVGSAFMVIVAPFLGGDFENWSELGELYWIPGGLGLALAGWGVSMVRRARKQTIEEPVDAAALAAAQGAAMQVAAMQTPTEPDDDPRSPGLPPKTLL